MAAEEHAHRIRETVKELNRVISLAAMGGLKVEIDTREIATFEGPNRITVEAKVYLPL